MARIDENNNFKNLDIFEPVLLAIEDKGFIKATDVQKRAIPKTILDENLIVAAPTGSGKTLVFASRIIEVTQAGGGLQSLVLVPTRELAKQVEEEIKYFSKYKPLNIGSIYGGSTLKSQEKILENLDVLIATPGRLSEHINNKTVDLSKIHMLVLDEMDAMLAPEFFDDIELMVSNMPRKRQTLMFSATITKEIGKFAQKYMKKVSRVLIENKKPKKELTQVFYEVEPKLKLSLLSHLLNTERSGLSIVFVNRKEVGDFIVKNLKHLGLEFGFVHKELSQSKRDKVLDDFRHEKYDVLVATDLAARGLDVEGVSHIYNYNIPGSQDKYIHRIGRCARAGATGKTIDFVASQDRLEYTKLLNERKLNIFRKELPEDLKEIKIKSEIKFRDFKTEAKKKR